MLKKSRQLEQIEKLTARQWGHVTRAQLLELGVAPTTIQNWVAQRFLTRVHAGVYALGHAEKNSWARACAAVLASGEGAYLSRASTLALFEVREWPYTPEVSSPRCCRRRGIHHHRTSTLTPKDTTRHLNIPTTTVSRAVLDLQPRLTDRQLIRLINDARHAKALSRPQLVHLLDRCSRIAQLIDPDQNPTRSGFEDDFVAFCARHRLPNPQTNATVAGLEVDALFPAHKLIVELDGWPYHQSRASFTSDRERDLRAAAAGHLTVRIPDGGLTDATAARLREILDRRAGSV